MIPISKPTITSLEQELVNDAVESTWISSRGKYLDQFESEFARLNNSKFCVSSSNGTTALHLAIASLDLKPGSEVILPSFTFIATINAVLYCNLKPVFVDIEPQSWCLNPSLVESAINQNTSAILPVHLYGIPCDMPRIMEIARKHQLKVIEDAAEAHFAEIEGKKVGTWGHIGIFSFFGNKILTTGEGGAILSDDSELIDRINLLKNHGMSPEKKYYHPVLGYNYRLNNISASIGVAQLRRASEILKRRSEVFNLYNTGLTSISNLLEYPKAPTGATTSPWLYTFALTGELTHCRDDLLNHLMENGIEARPGFMLAHKMEYININQDLPVSESVSSRSISLPTYFDLERKEISNICQKIIDFTNQQLSSH